MVAGRTAQAEEKRRPPWRRNGRVIRVVGARCAEFLTSTPWALPIGVSHVDSRLARRRQGLLQELVGECERLGGRALAMPTDATDEEAVNQLARKAVDNFGPLDVWVNNAGVTLFSRFEEAPIEEYRRVFETNLFGYVYGHEAGVW